jgi:hypothetical protein
LSCKYGDSVVTGVGCQDRLVVSAHAPPLPIGWLASLLELGAGRGYNPILGKETPNNFEGARSVILGQDHRFLFATNAGDNSVSSFSVGDDGKLTLLDAKRTGNVVPGRSGSAKSLAYDASTSTLFVCHALGPDHIRLMAVSMDGRLTARAERYTVNTADKTDRVATMVTLSPDGKFLVVGTTFDEPAKPNPDGSPILWVHATAKRRTRSRPMPLIRTAWPCSR